jgi:hypothetical protein
VSLLLAGPMDLSLGRSLRLLGGDPPGNVGGEGEVQTPCDTVDSSRTGDCNKHDRTDCQYGWTICRKTKNPNNPNERFTLLCKQRPDMACTEDFMACDPHVDYETSPNDDNGKPCKPN